MIERFIYIDILSTKVDQFYVTNLVEHQKLNLNPHASHHELECQGCFKHSIEKFLLFVSVTYVG